MKHRIAAGALIEHDGRVLLAHCVLPGRYNFWVAPGGGVKDEETLVEAARREAKEETGLLVEVDRLLYIEEFFNPDTRYCKFWFMATPISGELSCSHPEARIEGITEARWF